MKVGIEPASERKRCAEESEERVNLTLSHYLRQSIAHLP